MKKGIVKCPLCKGKGSLPEWELVGDFKVVPQCEKCQGDGELDWIERIVGKPPKLFSGSSTYTVTEETTSNLAEQLKEEIDNRILESIFNEVEQNIKEKEGKAIDNRVLSEFLFHNTSEQKFKGKKD